MAKTYVPTRNRTDTPEHHFRWGVWVATMNYQWSPTWIYHTDFDCPSLQRGYKHGRSYIDEVDLDKQRIAFHDKWSNDRWGSYWTVDTERIYHYVDWRAMRPCKVCGPSHDDALPGQKLRVAFDALVARREGTS